jgi:outer membrane protein OmpA-like peptidoglycan-associated protein
MKSISKYLPVLFVCWLISSSSSAQQKNLHPVFGAYHPRIVDNIDPRIDGELEIRPDANNSRKAWIFNFVPEGPVLAMLSVDNPEGNRIYDIPAQVIGGKSYPVGSLNFTFKNTDGNSSIILGIGENDDDISFMGDKLDNRPVPDYSPKEPPVVPQKPQKPAPKPVPPAPIPPAPVPPASAKDTVPASKPASKKWEGQNLKPGNRILLKNVHFELTQAILLPESFPELDKLANWMLGQPASSIRLEGHTDIIGNHKDNMDLSEQRVAAVKNYLIAKGVVGSRLETQGFGDTKPLIKKGTDEERKANRRVEFVLLKK